MKTKILERVPPPVEPTDELTEDAGIPSRLSTKPQKPLAHVLYVAGIQPFSAKSVHRYKRTMRLERIFAEASRRESSLEGNIIGSMILFSLLVCGIAIGIASYKLFAAAMDASMGYVSLSILITAFGVGAPLAFSLYAMIRGIQRRRTGFTKYRDEHVVPRRVRDVADEISLRLRGVSLSVEWLDVDPFLVAVYSDEEYHVDVWDEESFPSLSPSNI